jgi:hypothetical protein
MSSGYGGQYGSQYGYQNRGYGYGQQLSFRCNVDYRGAVTNIRIRQRYSFGPSAARGPDGARRFPARASRRRKPP